LAVFIPKIPLRLVIKICRDIFMTAAMPGSAGLSFRDWGLARGNVYASLPESQHGLFLFSQASSTSLFGIEMRTSGFA